MFNDCHSIMCLKSELLHLNLYLLCISTCNSCMALIFFNLLLSFMLVLTCRSWGFLSNWQLLMVMFLSLIRFAVASWTFWMNVISMLFIEVFVVLQAFFKLRHETKVEHIFVVGNTGKKFEKVLVKYLLLHIISLSGFWSLSLSTCSVCYIVW